MNQNASYEMKLMNRKIIRSKCLLVVFRLVRGVFLLMMCFVVLYPLIYMFSVSIREAADLYDPTVVWIPKHFTLENYSMVWELMEYPKTLLNTIFLSSVCTMINVAICSAIGYGFARFRFRMKKTLFALVIFTLLVPPQTVSIPTYMQYYFFDIFGIGQVFRLFGGEAFGVNLLDTHWTMILPAIFGQGIRAGVFIFLFRQFFRSMPRELEDAAYIDGCGIFRTFVQIMASNAGAAYIASIMFSFVWYWNDFYQIGLYFSDAKTLSVALGMLKGTLRSVGQMDYFTDPYIVVAQMQAGSLLTVAPLVIAFVFLQRKFTQSIDKTGIVG